MHIPPSMLQGAICPVTLGVGSTGVAAAGYAAFRSAEKPSPAKFAAVTSLIFALQMLNYPVQSGTSGHLVGALLAVALLNIPFAILSMSIVLAVQAGFFGDGGLNALGANVINMGLLGAGVMGALWHWLTARRVPSRAALALASWAAVMAGAAACSLEVAWAGAVPLHKALPAMLSVHALIGVGEALLTVGLVSALGRAVRPGSLERLEPGNDGAFAVWAGGLAGLAALLSPLASSAPDGLEWVAARLSFVEFHAAAFPALFPDYQAGFIGHPAMATMLAGLIGVGVVFGCTFAAGRLLRPARA